jgi:hypothetical protein
MKMMRKLIGLSVRKSQAPSNGFTSERSSPSKSFVLRVASVAPWESQMAAIWAS